MASAVKRTLSMRPEVDRRLVDYIERTPGANYSATVNEALVDFLEAKALESYRAWDSCADPAERAALDAFDAHDDAAWAAE
jgi:hypothetical protein